MSKRALTDQTLEPVSIAEAKKHVNFESDEFDAKFALWIRAARGHVEQRTRRIIARQKWRLTFSSFPSYIPAEPAPVHAVDQIQYIDADDVTQTVSSSVYQLDLDNEVIRPIYGQQWPTARGDANSVWCDVWSGYASASGSPQVWHASCPADLKAAILLMVGHLYENPSMESEIELYHNHAFELLIDPYWIPNA